MSKIQDVIQAKAFIEMLVHSVDPTTGEQVRDTILSKKENVDRLKYVMTLLDELIANNGEVVSVVKPAAFAVERIDTDKVTVSDTPLQISGFVSRINKQADSLGMKRIGPSRVSKWLISKGYLKETVTTVVKEIKGIGLTETSSRIGLVEQEKLDKKTGEVKYSVLLTRAAQEFILENLKSISEGDGEMQSEAAVEPIPEAAVEPIPEAAPQSHAAAEQDGDPRASYSGAAAVEAPQNGRNCRVCRFAQSGECFPQKEICADFEPAFSVSGEERESWPKFGDASAYRMKRWDDR